MKLTLLATALLISPFAVAQLRGVDLGDSCESVWEKEKNLGSFISHEKIRDLTIYEGIAFNSNAFIIYDCNEGIIKSQTVMINPEELNVAKYKLLKIKDELSAKFGTSRTADETTLKHLKNKGISTEMAMLQWGYSWIIGQNRSIDLRLQSEDDGTFYVVISQ